MLEADSAIKPTDDLAAALEEACEEIAPFFKGKDFEAFGEFDKAVALLREDASSFRKPSVKRKRPGLQANGTMRP